MKISSLVPVLALAGTIAASAVQPSADLAVVNARIFTGVPASPWAEVLLVRGNRILAVGSSAQHGAQAKVALRVIDAGGRLVIPGINDAHAHPTAAPDHVPLEGPPAMVSDPSWEEVVARVNAAAGKASKGQWIVGSIGAAVLQDPKATRFALDPLTGDRPLALGAWHGHGVLFNSAALRLLNVSETEADPPGGFFARMPDGKTVTGFAHEYADYALRQRLAMLAPPDAQIREYQRFANEAVSYGITSVQAMMTGYPAVEAAGLMAQAKLPLRVRAIDFPMHGPVGWRPPRSGVVRPRVTVSGVKFIVDGTPIERLMLLREPYTDAPSSRGRLNFSESDLGAALKAALDVQVQPMLHAVGDAAIDTVLQLLESTGGEKWRPMRPRIEHGDMLEPAHFERAKRMGVTIVQNPSHFMLGQTVRSRLGPRMARTWLVKSTLRAGVPFALGSDGPLHPYLNMMFAATHAGNPAEALTVEEALIAYTRGSAAAERMDDRKGTLAPGMLADLAMLSQDIFKVPPVDLPKTTSVLTVVDGTVVHDTTGAR